MRTWFKDAMAERREKIAQALKEAETSDGHVDADELDATVQRDIFSRLILASLKDKKLNLQEDQIVSNSLVPIIFGFKFHINLALSALFLSVVLSFTFYILYSLI